MAQRVSTGGHSVPEDAIRRRYERGLDNLFADYMPMADNWFVCNGSTKSVTEIARGGCGKVTLVSDLDCWRRVIDGRAA